MVYTFGSCKSTKDEDGEKFHVLNCDGVVVDKARTLREAETKADALDCALVIKILRTCGKGASLEVISSLVGESFPAPKAKPAVKEEEELEPIFGLKIKEGQTVTGMVTMEECPACEEWKEIFKDDLASGKLVEIKVGDSTPELLENAKIIEENNLVSDYPSILEITRKGDEYNMEELPLVEEGSEEETSEEEEA